VRVRAGGIFAALTLVLFGPATVAAVAEGPVGADPTSNFHVSSPPASCPSAPAGATCIAASVAYLNQARANLGQPPYTLPADFASLMPSQQLLILADSDRALYGLTPVPGLTDSLDQDASAGVVADADPVPSDPNWWAYTSNWAGGFANAVLAYEAWMYDDGPGSGNLDCTPSNSSGCWGHRHDVLWNFDHGGPLAMGAAAGADASGSRGYAMLLEEESPGVEPAYTYSWGSGAAASPAPQASAPAPVPALSAGHGPGSPTAQTARLSLGFISVTVHRHRVSIALRARAFASCTLAALGRLRGRVRRHKRCTDGATFAHLAAGRYRLRVRSGGATATRRVIVP
jgi:hypothetical protein